MTPGAENRELWRGRINEQESKYQAIRAYCLERDLKDRVVESLGGDPDKVKVTEAVRPRPGGPPYKEVPVCERCEPKYGRDKFPPGTKSKSDEKNSVSPWKTWEFDLVDWSTLEADGSAVGVPEAVQSLASPSSEEEATKAYWRLDGLIVNEHRIFAAAAPTVRCLLAALLHLREYRG
jgi:hypothetical protein